MTLTLKKESFKQENSSRLFDCVLFLFKFIFLFKNSLIIDSTQKYSLDCFLDTKRKEPLSHQSKTLNNTKFPASRTSKGMKGQNSLMRDNE